jgi:hypothetical protein
VKIRDRQAFRFHTPTDAPSIARCPHRPRTRRASVLSLGVLAVVLTACEKGPVEWRADTRELALPVSGAESAAGDAYLVLRADGSPALEPVVSVATVPADTAACPGSLRIAALSPTEIYSAWWSRRENGRAMLLSARSDNAGATWAPTVSVDTTDRGTLSCSRPAPSIAADSTSGYVHVTYFLNSPTGPGVFFSHSMDRGDLFHSPVPIMYGDRPSASAVTAADSLVIVAFEDPNSQRPQISLAMSRTWGHIFARERPAASTGTSTAERPLVALRASQVAVGWRNGSAVTARVGTLN